MERKLLKLYNELFNLSSFCELCQLAKLNDGCLSHYTFKNGVIAQLMIDNQIIWSGTLEELDDRVHFLKIQIDIMKSAKLLK